MDKQIMIKDLPTEERPREKLLSKGAYALSISELLAILLRTGIRNRSAMRVAEDIIAKYRLSGLGGVSARELSKIDGVGLVKAVTITAGIELGKRLATKPTGESAVISTSKDAAYLIMPRLRYESKECFLAIMLSSKNHVIAQVAISTGGLNFSLVQPRELFKEAIDYNAASIILAHNHPSGDPTPSKEDIDLTHNLVKAGKVMCIPIIDHIIIGDGKYVSLKEEAII